MTSVFPIPLGDQGLYGGRGISRVPAEFLLKAENIAFDDGQIRKEGGAAIYNSPLPPAWTERSNPKNFALNDVAWNGALLVAVGAADGTDAYIITSSDGVTWTERANPKNFALNGVVWSSALSLWVAVGAADGTDAYIVTSSDGITWAERTNPKNFGLNDVILLSDGTLVAVGAADGTDAYLVSSTDGATWTERSNPKNFGLNNAIATSAAQFAAFGVADGTDAYIIAGGVSAVLERTNPKNFALHGAARNGTSASSIYVYVGVADGTDAYLITSPGSNPSSSFTERTNPKNFDLYDVIWSGSEFLAVGAADGTDAYMVRSTDGITWSELVNPKNFALNASVWTGTFYVTVGAADGTDAYLLTSAGTATWTERTNPKNIAIQSAAWSGKLYAAVGGGDGTDAYVITSLDGTTWTERSNAKNIGLNDVIWMGNRWVAVGNADGTDPYILTSEDGITWTERAWAGTNTNLKGIAWNGITLVAVGGGGAASTLILTSPDGTNWTSRTSPKNFSLNDVVWNGDMFIAVGDADGTDAYLITSTDGITWTEQTNPQNKGLESIAWSGDLLVAVGESDGTDAYLITSPDGTTWTEQSNPRAEQLMAVAYGLGQYVAVGGGGSSSDAYIIGSVDGVNWTEQSNPKDFILNALAFDGAKFLAAGNADGTDAYMVSYAPNPTYVLGAAYWNYDGATPKMVALDSSGRLLMDGFDGSFYTTLKSGLTVTSSTYPVFVRGGKEAAANNRKLFTFTGANAVQVLSGSGTTTANLTTPPADWAAANQPTGGLIHKNRLWGYGNANDPHRLYYSLTTNHEDFTGTGAGSISVYPGEGEKIVNAISYKGYIIVWKYPVGIYIVDTTALQSANWQVERVNERLGGAGQGSAAVVEEDIVFIDHTGEIRLVAGITEFGDIGSRSLSDVQDMSVFIRDNYYLPSNTQWRMQYYSKKRELHIGASSNALGINDNRMVIDFNRQTPRFRNSTRDTCLYLLTRELNGVPELMSCDNLGNIWRLDYSTKSKDGLGYDSRFQTMYTDLGVPHLDKNTSALEIDFEPTSNINIAIDVYWDGVFQETTTMNMDYPSNVPPTRLAITRDIPLVGSGRRISLEIRNNNAEEDFAIQGLRIIHDNAGLPEEA